MRSSRIAVAVPRYTSSSTRALSRIREAIGRPRRRMLSDALGDGKGLAMLFETLNAEQFRADRLLDVSRERCGRTLHGPEGIQDSNLPQRSVATARAWPE